MIPEIIHLKLVEKNKYLNIPQSLFYLVFHHQKEAFSMLFCHIEALFITEHVERIPDDQTLAF